MKRNKMKKVAAMLVGVMLLGTMVSVQAAELTESHEHEYVYCETVISSGPYGNHAHDGQVCEVGFFRFNTYMKCDCGTILTGSANTVQKLYHPVCGLGWVILN